MLTGDGEWSVTFFDEVEEVMIGFVGFGEFFLDVGPVPVVVATLVVAVGERVLLLLLLFVVVETFVLVFVVRVGEETTGEVVLFVPGLGVLRLPNDIGGLG